MPLLINIFDLVKFDLKWLGSIADLDPIPIV